MPKPPPKPVQLKGRRSEELRKVLDRLTPLVNVDEPGFGHRRQLTDTDAVLVACRHYAGVVRRRVQGKGLDPDEIIERWLTADGKLEQDEPDSFRGVGRPSVD